MEPRGPFWSVATIGAMREEDELRVLVLDQVDEAGNFPEDAVARIFNAPGDAIRIEDVDGGDDLMAERIRSEDAGELGGLVGRKVRQAKRMQFRTQRARTVASSW